MKPNSIIIKYYQLIGEGLCFYFVYVPVMAIYGESISVWGYLAAIILTAITLSIGIRYISNYSIYLLSLIVLVSIISTVFEFSIVASAILIGFMIWRFIIHESQPDLRNQMQLIVYTLFVLFVDIIFYYHIGLVFIALLMLLVMIGGYQLSHTVVDGSIGAKKFSPFIAGFFGIVLSGSVLLFFGYQIVRTVLPNVLQTIFNAIAGGILKGLELIGFTRLDIKPLQNLIEGIANNSNIQPERREIKNPLVTDEQMKAEYNPPDLVNWWTIGIGAGLLLVVLLLLTRRKLQNQGKDSKLERVLSMPIQNEYTKDNKTGGFFSRSIEKPTNEIRLKVFNFERLTAKKGLGRKQSETIEEWFNRINIDSSYLNVYQKIRYGDSDLSEYEMKQFDQQLEEIKITLDI